MDWPVWWTYELICENPHLQKRMAERGFNEVELRETMQNATSWSPDPAVGRFRVETRFRNAPWRVIVEPDVAARQLHVVTAFEV